MAIYFIDGDNSPGARTIGIENLNEEICNLKNEVSSYKRQFTNQNVKVNSIERKQDESIKDIEVEYDKDKFYEDGTDTQLDAAIEYLENL